MTKFEELLKNSLAYADARKAPAEELSPQIAAVINDALAKKFRRIRVLSEKEMRLMILKLLTKSSATGAEIVAKLKDARLKTEPEGEGVILGLLYAMVSRNLIFARFDENTATRRYQIDDAGKKLLTKDEGTVLGGLGLAFSEDI